MLTFFFYFENQTMKAIAFDC